MLTCVKSSLTYVSKLEKFCSISITLSEVVFAVFVALLSVQLFGFRIVQFLTVFYFAVLQFSIQTVGDVVKLMVTTIYNYLKELVAPSEYLLRTGQ